MSNLLSTAIDEAGNAVFVAWFTGSLDLADIGGEVHVSEGPLDSVVVKVLPNGELAWARQVGGGAAEFANGVAFTSDGDVVVVGNLAEGGSEAYLGDTVVDAPGGAGFVAQLDDGSGAVEWLTLSGVGVSPATMAVAMDDRGDVWTAGWHVQPFDVGGVVVGHVASGDAHVERFSSTGEVELAVGFGGAGWQSFESIASDRLGGVFVGGYFDADFTIGSVDLATSGGEDAMLVRLGALATPAWAMRLGGSGDDTTTRVTSDVAGNLYVTAGFQGELALPGATLESVGGRDVMLASFTADGATRWARSWGGPGDDSATAPTWRSDDTVLFAGAGGAESVGCSDAIGPDAQVYLAAARAANGASRWTQVGTSSAEASVGSIAVSGGSSMVGWLGAPLSPGDDVVIPATSDADIFFVRYD